MRNDHDINAEMGFTPLSKLIKTLGPGLIIMFAAAGININTQLFLEN
jgi:hypothetical protein